MIVHSSITSRGRVSLIADLNPDSVTFPQNLPLPQAQWKLMFGLSLGGGQTEIIMLISSARLGLELSLARSSRHFFVQTLALIWFFPALRFLIDPKQVFTRAILHIGMHISHKYAYQPYLFLIKDVRAVGYKQR